MKKKLFSINIILILIFILIFSFSCKKEEEETKTIPNETPTPIETIIPFETSTNSLELEVNRTKEISFSSEVVNDLEFKLDNDFVSIEVSDDKIIVSSNKVGLSKLNVYYEDELIKTIDINVIEEVIFLPVATGKILLKGIDKVASVKVIITKPELKDEEIVWTLDNFDCVEMTTQGSIAKFQSIARGHVTVTVTCGEYSNSFIIYVTNIRGDID